jgi:hypothetical protein
MKLVTFSNHVKKQLWLGKFKQIRANPHGLAFFVCDQLSPFTESLPLNHTLFGYYNININQHLFVTNYEKTQQ